MQPMSEDAGVDDAAMTDVGDAGASDASTNDAAAADPATCEIDCARACSSVQGPGGRPWGAGGGTCRRSSATSVACTIMFPCGRAPCGLSVERDLTGEGESVASYLAECAMLEAASVYSFERLERELIALGAPVSLAVAAKNSALDERRHAAATSELAMQFAAPQVRFAVEEPSQRGLYELALENAIEGCVRETWGAVVAAFQAEHAQDARVRELMREIAVDECGHAALAWRVADWAEAALRAEDPMRAKQVTTAREAAFAELLQSLRRAHRDDEMLVTLGLPSERDAVQMAESMWTLLATRGSYAGSHGLSEST